MAVRPRPTRLKGPVKQISVAKLKNLVRSTQRFRRFTVVWCNGNGVPFNTTGFFAIARFPDGTFIQATRFDSFGVAVFSRLRTPLRSPIVITTFNSAGVLFRTRNVPAGVAAFVIIG
ncbi:hypothetical protein EDM56_12455 [Brevibacillus fluminis]|uniref:Uncharacterized protein n=1 Tax=Brevibacillus fluminis TaxID=511487 RepID=A0A3M8DPC9_9BACL|nr:hypothetical protein [Brevibacillus fluminis]RNB89958.1 hypothetical protein EDM56_12455 [Brevibacillus fluminis]